MNSPEILVVALIIIVLFGGKKLPDITKGLIDNIKSFRSAFKEGVEEANKNDQ